ncbi:hypothetical protein AJ78_08715 [Emergomyces pasteurianus Ep9510]|uniref:Uncharacterized protein n=1 Tax=Emergomyces pasteurianus Ep9510 TaxID=1447872 RepID=A0A1J9P2T0_9EURO|nr:hypothetical protein AJ78_08715 [Emergomyces pasteurianus Ep9510]
MNNDISFDSEYVDEKNNSRGSNFRELLFSELVRESDIDTGTELSEESMKSDSTGNMFINNDISELDHFIKNVTDNKYDAGPEETKITLLYTKSENKKLRVKSFIISHNPESLLDLLNHLLSMTIDDEIFAPEFEKLEDIY